MPFYSPLRYPGGKGRLGDWIAKLLRYNHISGGWYAEPYAGGAGVSLHLLMEGYVRKIIINDIDTLVYSFWKSIVEYNNEILYKLKECEISLNERKRQLKIIKNKNRHNIVDVGFAFFYINRTSRSGIISGGVIGGNKQDGKWKIDARFNKNNLYKRIELIGHYKNRIELHNKDAMLFLSEISNRKLNRGLAYLDPPYYKKSNDLYENSYKKEDHKRIAQFIKTFEEPWLITYDNCKEIENIYNWSNGGLFSIYYSASQKTRGNTKELVFCGNAEFPCQPYSKR